MSKLWIWLKLQQLVVKLEEGKYWKILTTVFSFYQEKAATTALEVLRIICKIICMVSVTHVSDVDCCYFSVSPNRTVPDQNREILNLPLNENILLQPLNNGVAFHNPEPVLPPIFVAAGDGEIANDSTPFVPPTPEPVKQTSFWDKLTLYKYDVVLLSLLVQLLYSWSLFTHESSYFFLPLAIYVVTKQIWFPSQSKSNIANVLMLLQGISGSNVQKIMNVTQWAGIIAQDVCVYLFTTICIQSLLITLKNDLFT